MHTTPHTCCSTRHHTHVVDHLKAHESMKRYRKNPNLQPQGTRKTSPNKNRVQLDTDKHTFSKENTYTNGTSMSSPKTSVCLITSSSEPSPVGTTSQLPSPRTYSILRYLAPVSRTKAIESSSHNSTDVKRNDVDTRVNSHCSPCVGMETRLEPKQPTDGDKKRKANYIFTGESQGKAKRPRASNKVSREDSVNGTRTSPRDNSPATRKLQTRFIQSSLQLFLQPKQLISDDPSIINT